MKYIISKITFIKNELFKIELLFLVFLLCTSSGENDITNIWNNAKYIRNIFEINVICDIRHTSRKTIIMLIVMLVCYVSCYPFFVIKFGMERALQKYENTVILKLNVKINIIFFKTGAF